MNPALRSCRSRSLTPLRLTLLVLSAWSISAIPAGAATPGQINDAVQRGIAYLYTQQENGNWDFPTDPPHLIGATGRNRTGPTALVTYSLLVAGENATNEHLAPALAFLQKEKTVGTYALGMRTQVWPYLKPSRELHAVELQDGRLLAAGMGTKGEADGLWHYTPPSDASYDHSVSQFGVLGLWALEQTGFEVPSSVWQRADVSWRKHQLPDGSWCYENGVSTNEFSKSTTTMTAAGLATLYITSDHLSHREGPDPNIERALQWLGDHFEAFFANGIQGVVTQYYGLYGLERIGVACGRRNLGTHDWFAEGADWLVQRQNPDGSWGSPNDLWGFNARNDLDTAFALIFLSRGRAPVVMEKLQYGLTEGAKTIPAHWNQHPRDLATLAHWMSTQLEEDLNWQTTALDVPVEQLHDAPILFISGDQALAFTDAEKSKLRQFVEEGGMIVGNADGDSTSFSKSFQKLGVELFPSYEFRQCPDAHPIFTNQQFRASKWQIKPRILGLSNGVRELMLLPETDLSRAFEGHNELKRSELYELADDIVLYAVDKKGLRTKGDVSLVNVDPKVTVDRHVKLARLQYDGNWDPEPGGWRRLAAILHNEHTLELMTATIKLGDGSLASSTAPRFQLAHLTGTTAFTLTEPQREDIAKFIAGGGTLIVDAAGGSQQFVDSAEKELSAMFGADAQKALAEPLAADNRLFNLPGADIDSFAYRRFARGKIVGKLDAPRLCEIERGGKAAAYFSREDLSAGLVSEPVDGVLGYDPETATAIMRNIVLAAAPPSTLPPRSLAAGKPASASNVYQHNAAYAASMAFDANPATRWATDAGTKAAWLQVDLGQPRAVGKVTIAEPYGFTRKFQVQYQKDGQWQNAFEGTTLGANFAREFEPVKAQVWRLNVTDSTDGPTISEFQLLPPAAK